MAKGPTISTITAAFASASKLNANFAAIDTAFDNTLSLDGSTPNAMGADLDMNSQDLLNVSALNAATIVLGGTLMSPSAVAAADTHDLDTRATVAAVNISSGFNFIRTSGFATVGDGGHALYKRIVLEPSHALKITSLDGAFWELVPDSGGINVMQAGAVGDGVVDDTQSIQDCINFLGTPFVGNGRIRIPPGVYKTTSTILVEDDVILEGEGYGGLDIGSSTVIDVASGVTGFIVRKGDTVGGDGNYGDNSLFRNLEIKAAGKNSTTTTGTITGASKTLTLAAAEDFANGDMIMVRGAAESQTLMNSRYLTAATTSSSTAVTTSITAGIYVGMVIEIAGANFPADTYVVSRSGVDVVMSAVAGNTVSAGAITYLNDLVTRIESGGGTTTLTINEAADRSVSGAVVLHYDCGIYAQSRMSMERCVIREFQGAGLMFHAGSDVDHEFTGTTNANNWRVHDCNFKDNRNGLRLKGNDVNAGSAVSMTVGGNDEYGLVDASFLGNYFFGLHVSGGLGYMVVFLNAKSTFVACYTEGGTHNTFAQRTMIIGGLMSGSVGDGLGGNTVVQDTNVIYQSATRFYPLWHDHQFTIGDQNTAASGIMSASGPGGNDIKFTRTSAGSGQNGLWGWQDSGQVGDCGMYFSDAAADNGAGHAYFLNGFYIGREQSTVTQSNFRRVAGGTVVPSSGTWVKGDRVHNHAAAVGDPYGWICTVNGTPGTWEELRGVGTQQSTIADAVVAHNINSTFSDTEVEATLDALGVKINSLIAVLDHFGLTATS